MHATYRIVRDNGTEQTVVAEAATQAQVDQYVRMTRQQARVHDFEFLKEETDQGMRIMVAGHSDVVEVTFEATLHF